MTSNDAPASGARPPRRRTLGRGPGTTSDGPPAGRGTPEEGAGTPPGPSPAAAPETTAAEPAATGEETAETPPEDGPLASPAESGQPVILPEGGAAVPGETGPATVERAGDGMFPGGPPPAGPVAPLAQDAAAESVVRASGTAAGPDGPAAGAPEPAPAEAAGADSAQGASGAGAGEDDDGRFTVRLANFEGPFDLLLQLIAKHKLDVTEVALSGVTDEFMAYIRAMGSDWDLDETTEFLVVAATLLDLKAARLLPAAEVEDEADLALLEARDLLFARLLQYRAYKQIAGIFSRRLDDEARRHPRTVGLEPRYAELLPEVVIGIGPEGFAGLAVKAMQPRPRPQVYVDHIHAPLVSVQEQAGIVVARLRELGEANFRALVEDTDDTLTVVARFLALLELYREKAVALDQEAALGELTVRWTGGDTDVTPTVTDEFDRPPEQPEEERKP
ncbi:segregation and condensation protein A [Streptomyces sp. NPDC000348]|uniref:segregation and condensation protein A n=1 Tax=Streptomyces sp. NPDC000348 TaxID=3364538 RepID=UPI003689A2E8